MPLNYEQSKVYKIWSPQGDKIYIGSTTKQYLSQRMTAHRNDYNCWKSGKAHFVTSYSIFDEYGLDNCHIELLEAKPCSSKDELHALEGKYMRELQCVNKCIAGRSHKEYYEENKDVLIKNKKIYYEQTKDYQSALKNQVFYCSCGKPYTHSNRVRHQKSAFHINNKK
jgi:GIY-YIG catalytic domain